MMLQRSVGTVDQEEARNGASQSDAVRLSAREQNKDSSKVPMKVYLERAAQFRAKLKKSKAEDEKKPECPVERARAESTTGENVPLNWLMADHFGGETEFAPEAKDVAGGEELNFQQDFSLGIQPKVSSQPESLLADEWLLSPCA